MKNFLQLFTPHPTLSPKGRGFKTEIVAKPSPLGGEGWVRGNNIITLLSLFFFVIFIGTASANQVIEQNFFASLRSPETNVRSGPGPNYPIKFTFKMRGIPVKVINGYDNWYEIKDYDGDTGWVNQNLLTKKRTLIVKTTKTFVNVYSSPTEKSKNILKLENDVTCDFLKCNGPWCAIKVSNKKGWIDRREIWGVGDKE